MKKVLWLDALSLIVAVSGLIAGVHFWKHPIIPFSKIGIIGSAYVGAAFLLLEYLSLLYSIIMLMVKDPRRWMWLVPNVLISGIALFILGMFSTRMHPPLL